MTSCNTTRIRALDMDYPGIESSALPQFDSTTISVAEASVAA